MIFYMYIVMMFVFVILGLLFMLWFMYIVLKKKFLKKLFVFLYDIEEIFFMKNFYLLKGNNFVDMK